MDIEKALQRIFNLGQAYWAQADSESAAEHRKSSITHDSAKDLMADVQKFVDSISPENARLHDENKSLKSAWQVETLEKKDSVIAKQEECNDWLRAENARLQAIIDEANAQEPCFEVGRHGKSGEYFLNEIKANSKLHKGMKLYAAPIPKQQSPAVAVPDEETNFCALKSITDSQVNAVARAFWRRIYAYRNDYDIELPKPLPVEFMAHMATALTWVDKEPSPRITEQDVREIAQHFMSWGTLNCSDSPVDDWIKQDSHYILNKINK